MNGLSHQPVVDCHIHLRATVDAIVNCTELMEANKYKAINIVCVPQLDNESLVLNPVALLFKALKQKQVYVFPGLRYPAGGITANGTADFADQVKLYKRMGADGIKMHEGKPTVRKKTGVALSAPVYDDLYSTLEEQKFPVLYHVGDPWIFWNENTAPAYAKKYGWVYADGTFPDNETIFAETEALLKKHPKLRVIFAHFYFMSCDRARAADFLDRHPNVGFDLTPGVEMYPDFTQDRDNWREFFVKYQDRIFFGTDDVGGEGAPNIGRIADGMYRTYVVRNFLETDHEFLTWEARSRGIALEKPVLEKIYSKNFEGLAGSAPAKLDIGLAIEDCEKAMSLASGCTPQSISELHRIAMQLRSLL